jgi:hypothetical protein
MDEKKKILLISVLIIDIIYIISFLLFPRGMGIGMMLLIPYLTLLVLGGIITIINIIIVIYLIRGRKKESLTPDEKEWQKIKKRHIKRNKK